MNINRIEINNLDAPELGIYANASEAELLHYVLADGRGRSSRKSEDGGVQELSYRSDLEVVRPEIVAPLGDAVGFVHHDERNGQDVQV